MYHTYILQCIHFHVWIIILYMWVSEECYFCVYRRIKSKRYKHVIWALFFVRGWKIMMVKNVICAKIQKHDRIVYFNIWFKLFCYIFIYQTPQKSFLLAVCWSSSDGTNLLLDHLSVFFYLFIYLRMKPNKFSYITILYVKGMECFRGLRGMFSNDF